MQEVDDGKKNNGEVPGMRQPGRGRYSRAIIYGAKMGRCAYCHPLPRQGDTVGGKCIVNLIAEDLLRITRYVAP